MGKKLGSIPNQPKQIQDPKFSPFVRLRQTRDHLLPIASHNDRLLLDSYISAHKKVPFYLKKYQPSTIDGLLALFLGQKINILGRILLS
jgi:hypothetical protein